VSREKKIARALQDYTGAAYMTCLNAVRKCADELRADPGLTHTAAVKLVGELVGAGDLLGLTQRLSARTIVTQATAGEGCPRCERLAEWCTCDPEEP
jgi:hypothetical protein